MRIVVPVTVGTYLLVAALVGFTAMFAIYAAIVIAIIVGCVILLFTDPLKLLSIVGMCMLWALVHRYPILLIGVIGLVILGLMSKSKSAAKA